MKTNHWVFAITFCSASIIGQTQAATQKPEKVYDKNQTVARAQMAVKKLLIDPYSAHFRTIWVKNNGTMCGAVNAKNRLAGC